MPLWLLTMGPTISEGTVLVIPYEDLIISLILLISPLFVGILIRSYKETWARNLNKFTKPLIWISLLTITVIFITSYRFLLATFTWRIILSGLILALTGLVFGALLSWAFQMKWHQIVVVSLETSNQNIGVVILVLQFSLNEPDSDIAITPSIAAMSVYMIYLIVRLITFKYVPSTKVNIVDGIDAKSKGKNFPNESTRLIGQGSS